MEQKYINIKEFREKGYLQEVNRRFLHPLGLALEITIDDGKESITGVWDSREDPEGFIYDLENSDSDRVERFKVKRDFIESEFDARNIKRREKLGYEVEPIG